MGVICVIRLFIFYEEWWEVKRFRKIYPPSFRVVGVRMLTSF